MRSSPQPGIHFTLGISASASARKDFLLSVGIAFMPITVFVNVVTKQRSAIGEQLYDDRIGGEDVLAFVFGQPFGVNALVVEGRVNFESVSLAGIEVIEAMTGGGMNDA